MRKKKIIIVVSCIILMFAAVGSLMIPRWLRMQPDRALDWFAREIEAGRVGDMRLRVYYLDPFFHTRTIQPISINELINGFDSIKTVVDVEGSSLEDYIELLRLMNRHLLVSSNSRGKVDVRIYYVFETNEGRRIFDMGMWVSGTYGNVLINGQEFEWNDIFLDIVMPFLPDADSLFSR